LDLTVPALNVFHGGDVKHPTEEVKNVPNHTLFAQDRLDLLLGLFHLDQSLLGVLLKLLGHHIHCDSDIVDVLLVIGLFYHTLVPFVQSIGLILASTLGVIINTVLEEGSHNGMVFASEMFAVYVKALIIVGLDLICFELSGVEPTLHLVERSEKAILSQIRAFKDLVKHGF
jgi:hypothetical protein